MTQIVRFRRPVAAVEAEVEAQRRQRLVLPAASAARLLLERRIQRLEDELHAATWRERPA